MTKKLYLVHCGFYDPTLFDGVYESHVNVLVVAETFEAARLRAKEIAEFREKKMHIDGIQEIRAVDGFRVSLTEEQVLSGQSILISHRHQDQAPKAHPPFQPSS